MEYIKEMYREYFLGFADNKRVKKISYAASFGSEVWDCSEKHTIEIRHLLSDFTSVSVREKSAINICKKHFNIHAEQVIDPTLLLDKDDYLKLISGYKISDNKNKLLSYILDLDASKNRIINKLSNSLQLDTLSVCAKEYFNIKKFYRIYKSIHPSVEEWLSGFSNCNYVITDSYHGVIFSLIFNKQFIAIGNEKRGIDRFISLLGPLNLEHRLICSVDDLSRELMIDKINYTEVNKLIEIYKDKSKDFLLSNI